jgi:hypothetical protein
MKPLKDKIGSATWAYTAKRKADSEVPTYTDGRPTKRHHTPDSLIAGFVKLFSPCRLDDLPQEILLGIFQYFAEPWVLTDDLPDWDTYALDRESRIRHKTLIALTTTCRWLNQPATSILYRCAHLPTAKSLVSFLGSLYVQPSLTELVKQVSCPQDVLMTVTYAFQRSTSEDVPVELSSRLLWPGRPKIGYFCPRGGNSLSSPTNSRSHVRGYALYSVLERIPGIRALSMTCCSPWYLSFPVSPFPLEHLSKLSIAMSYQPGLETRSPSVADDLTLRWLTKSNLGRYRALKQLELVHLRGKWIANLVTVDATDGSGLHGTEKYVSSLTTRWRDGGGTSEWDLLSLGQDIFSPAHLHTLDYAGQSRRCSGACSKTQASGWDLNRFLATTGRRIKTLSLDWEHEHAQLGQLGPAGLLTSLPMLTNLTHLTVSMQLLFQRHRIFYNQLLTILEDAGAEFARMLPASLRVLRISEFMLDVLRPRDQNTEDRNVRVYNNHLWRFMQLLRAYWLDARGDRELWFRHCLELERHPRMADERSRCLLRWLFSPQWHQEDIGREFVRVYRMLPVTAARTRDANKSM